MKTKFTLAMMLIVLFVIPSYTAATTVYETTGWIVGADAFSDSFQADQTPYTYQATLADLSISPFGFDYLFLAITSTTTSYGSIVGPGSFIFDVVPNELLFANVFGIGDGDTGFGLFGVKIETVPIPAAIYLLGAGFVGLVGIRRKIKK